MSTRWNPFAELEQMLDRYNRDVRLTQSGSQERIANNDWTPAVDIKESTEAYHIHVELPGLEKEDVKVTLDEGVLSIEESESLKKTGEKKHHRIEAVLRQVLA